MSNQSNAAPGPGLPDKGAVGGRPPSSCSGPVGRHPWEDDQGRICPRTAGTWLANMILTAGGTPSTAFACAKLLSEEIENHPAKFGMNPALDRDPINPNRRGPIPRQNRELSEP